MSIKIKMRIDSYGLLAWRLVRNRCEIRHWDIGMEEKRKGVNKSDSLKICTKGHFGQFWGKNKMEDQLVNYVLVYEFDSMDFLEVRQEEDLSNDSSSFLFFEQGLIKNYKKDVVIRDLLDWSCDKQT